MSIVARSARLADGKTDVVPDDVVSRGKTAAEKFLLRWRGEADPRQVKAIDTYWICTAEHGLNASTFTARVVASTGADCGAALSSAVGALSGPLHGGAPAYVKPMLDEVKSTGDAAKWVEDALAQGKRIMGFGHRVYRAEDPRSRILKRTARELGSPYVEVAEELGSLRSQGSKSALPIVSSPRTSSTTRRSSSASPDPRRLSRRDVRLLARRRLVRTFSSRETGRLFRPSARYIGPAERTLS
jgi:citrate synthase